MPPAVPDSLRADRDSGLLLQLPDRGVDGRLPRLDTATRQLPPGAKLRIGGVMSVKEQDPLQHVDHDEANTAANDDRQTVGHVHRHGSSSTAPFSAPDTSPGTSAATRGHAPRVMSCA